MKPLLNQPRLRKSPLSLSLSASPSPSPNLNPNLSQSVNLNRNASHRLLRLMSSLSHGFHQPPRKLKYQLVQN